MVIIVTTTILAVVDIIPCLPLVFFPSILLSIMVLGESTLSLCGPASHSLSAPDCSHHGSFSSIICIISSIPLTLPILRHIYISKASNLLIFSFLVVHVSDLRRSYLQILV